MPEDLQAISSSRVAASEVPRHSFATVRRGFDPHEVRAYLELIARELTVWEQHDQELRRQLAEVEERSLHPVIDEATLTAALGQQSAQILRNAHEEAARITLEADEAGAAVLREAHSQAADVRVQAESGLAERIAEAELSVASVRQQAQEEAGRQLEAARAEGEGILVHAREQGQAMIDQAQETRKRVLADMARRRRTLGLQIEQFRAARDELAASVLSLRDSVDRIVDDLSRTDDKARAAAAEVARRARGESPEGAEAGGAAEGEPTLEASPQTAPVEAVTTDDGPPEDAPEPAAEGDAVEGLFARLRAGHPGAGEPERPIPGAGEAEHDATAPHGVPAVGSDPAPAGPDDPVRGAGAELLDPLVALLAKRVKRALQDDQNGLLDRLRSGSGAWSDDLLVAEEDQRALYVEAASGTLAEAAAAGITFARSQRGGARGRAPAPDEVAVARAAEGLAATVVTQLRRRLADGDDDAAADRVGAAYREWRGERIERLAGDCAVEAFSSGVLVGTGKAGLRWVVGADGPACADCDDNALAGTVPSGGEFPTGHRHPPAHAGCRCLVVPTPG